MATGKKALDIFAPTKGTDIGVEVAERVKGRPDYPGTDGTKGQPGGTDPGDPGHCCWVPES